MRDERRKKKLYKTTDYQIKKHKHSNGGTAGKANWFSKIQNSQGYKATLSQKTIKKEKASICMMSVTYTKVIGDMNK